MGNDPEEPDAGAGDLSIDIDPELIAAAMSAVDSRVGKKKKRGFAPSRLTEETGDPVTVDLELEVERSHAAMTATPVPEPAPRPAPRAAPPPDGDEERRLAVLRLRETTDRLRRVEAELVRTSEARDALDRQVRELREAALRVQNDAEQARIRARRDREEIERGAEEKVLRGLLDIVENVERGVAHADADPARVLAGLNMIAEQFRMLLRRVGVERIEAAPGTLFDPAQHEALLHLPTGDVLPGCIVNEVAAGFLLRGRLMRPARVVVATTPPDGK